MDTTHASSDHAREPLGVWLTLLSVMLSVILVILLLAVFITISVLVTPGEFGIHGFKALILYEAVTASIIMFSIIRLLILLKNRDRRFPNLFIFLFIFVIVSSVFDLIGGGMLRFPTTMMAEIYAQSSKAVYAKIILSAVFLLIWGSYVKLSRRARTVLAH
jgi:hypothetical protein